MTRNFQLICFWGIFWSSIFYLRAINNPVSHGPKTILVCNRISRWQVNILTRAQCWLEDDYSVPWLRRFTRFDKADRYNLSVLDVPLLINVADPIFTFDNSAFASFFSRLFGCLGNTSSYTQHELCKIPQLPLRKQLNVANTTIRLYVISS